MPSESELCRNMLNGNDIDINIYKNTFININIFVIIASLCAKMMRRKMKNEWKNSSGLKYYWNTHVKLSISVLRIYASSKTTHNDDLTWSRVSN